VIVNIGLPDWFGASGLRVTVKQPDSRGIPGFFTSFFSVVTHSTCVRSAGKIAGWSF
jgi:hypothetical protein